MALTDIEKDFLNNYFELLFPQDTLASRLSGMSAARSDPDGSSLQALSRSMLTNRIFGASTVGRDLRSLVLGGPVRATTFTDPFNQAVSGSLRADVGTVRQASRNMGEAGAMMGEARAGMTTIVDALTEMEDMIDRIDSGELSGSSATVQENYDALRDKITSAIDQTGYNGIAVLDASRWGTGQVDADGNVHVQSTAAGGYDVTLEGVDAPASGIAWADLSGVDLAASGTRATQLSHVQSLKSEMEAIQDRYEDKETNLLSQEIQLQSRAQLLEKAADMRMPPDPDSSVEQSRADLVANLVTEFLGAIVDSRE